MSDEKQPISGEIYHMPRRGQASVENSKEECGSVDIMMAKNASDWFISPKKRLSRNVRPFA